MNDSTRSKLEKMKFGFAFSNFIAKRPLTNLFISFLIVLLFFPGINYIKSKWSTKIWYDEDHPEMVKLTQFEEQFGGDTFVAVSLYAPDGIFREKIIKKMEAISEDLWLVKDVIRVESLSNYNTISSAEDEIIIEPFITEDTLLTPDNLKELQKKALADDTIPNIYLSNDSTLSIIYAHLKPNFDELPDYEAIINQTREVMKKHETDDLKLSMMGGAPANHSFKEVSSHDNRLILPFMFTFLLVLLYTQFRSVISVVLPIALIGLSVGVTFGLMGHVQIYYNSLLAAIPGVLLAICIADAVHILNSYFHFRGQSFKSKEALTYALTKNFQPTLLTSISTAISFTSLGTSEIAPIRDLGLLCGFGTMLAWIFTYLFIGPCISILSNFLDKKELKTFSLTKLFKKDAQKSNKHENARKVTEFIYRFRYLIIVLFTSATVGSVAIALQNEVNSDPIKYFHPDVPIRAAYDFAGTKLDGMRGIEFVVDSGKNEGMKQPEFLRKLDKFIQFLESDEQISQVQSIVDIIKKMNRTLNNGDEAFYAIPETKEGVAEELLLYTMGLPAGMDLNNQFTLDNRMLRLKVVWSIDTSKESEAKMYYILDHAKKHGLKLIPVGNAPLNLTMNRQVVSSFFTSMAMALGLVTLLLFLVYKDLYISLLSLLPNVIPLCFGGALMYLMGKTIDMGTSIVCTVCLGIAVDDTIHFISSYKQYRKQGLSIHESVAEVFTITGKALVITTLLLVVGFGSFIFADFVPNRNFGIFCSLILALALVTDLLFLPALLMVADRKQD